ncbi:hypothetical protein [Paenibacillus sp. GCM10027626]|uniref:hypothetical protein n=1 Tax=Paenibacillus sp. GCM10027626 TaxID=3273411 RepID=UPI0036318706
MDVRERARILRQYEIYCFQLSFYLLQDEQLSTRATMAALLELAFDPHFLKGNREIQKEEAKQIVIRSSLRAMQDANTEVVS